MRYIIPFFLISLAACSEVAYEETVEERESVSGKSDTFTPEQATAESPFAHETTSADDSPYDDGTYEYDDTSADEDPAPTETEPDNSSTSSLADEFDYCGEFELYGNGTCETICWEPDPDCENQPEPTCNTTWEDGFCDFGCEEVDPDCQDDVGEQAETEILSEWERLEICRRFSDDVQDYVVELAESLCIEFDERDAEFAACVNSCLNAYHLAQ